ncbi:hypothetical protein [Mycetocola sp.]|uniref:hypothetical protein n=1 Tax=Mycetocola sp. TaxID=1871042 RepID=UPI002619FDC8|nr:hypothetical protein [Mycetocola sp.]
MLRGAVDSELGDRFARWGGRPPFQELPAPMRLWLPAILSFVVQVPATIAILWRIAPVGSAWLETASVGKARRKTVEHRQSAEQAKRRSAGNYTRCSRTPSRRSTSRRESGCTS